ncbi:MAG: histidine kinase [Rhizobacter sp.]|nr:histidine kinase [Ferruginibacter sp.]
MRKILCTYKVCFLTVILSCCYLVSKGQPTGDYFYQYYNTSQGLPSPEITCLIKDSDGFLWLGTATGVSMYDGYNFTNYFHTKENEPIGYVNCIRAGTGKKLWIGSSAGLFYFNGSAIIKLSKANSLPQGINDILLQRDGSMWLATENGPAHIARKEVNTTGTQKWDMSRFIIPQGENDIKNVLLISSAPDGSIFFSREHHLYRHWQNRTELLHTTKGERDNITSLFPVNHSRIFFDGASSELTLYDSGKVTISGFNNFFKPGQFSHLPGSWYIGTRGAFFLHPQTGTVSRHISFSDQYFSWAKQLLEDDNFFWIASYNGLIKLKPVVFSSYAVQKINNDNDYFSFAELKNGKLLLGANHGNVYEKKGDHFRLYKQAVVPSAEIKNIYEDKNGGIWLASGYQGLVLTRNGKTERFTVKDGLHDNSLYSFLETRDNKLFVVGDAGISEIVVDSNNSIAFRKFIFPPNSSRFAKFFSAIEGPDGTIWMGGEEGIVTLKDNKLKKISISDGQLNINFLIKDKEDKIWIATAGNGIMQASFDGGNGLQILKKFTENDGLHSSHYLTLLADKDNNIWAGSSNGVTVIGQTKQFTSRIINFNESDGFIKAGYNYIQLKQAANGMIWAATTFGITAFDPEKINYSSAPPLVYITGVRQIERNNPVIEKPSHPYPPGYEFEASDNSFHFNFTAADYASQDIKYYYRLDGLDTAWTSAGNQRDIGFENLSPGKYTFRVKALNNKGAWSKQDAVFSFSIIPPFWKRWWFAALLSVALAAIAVFFTRKRIEFVKKKEEQKTALQKIRAANYREQLEIEQIINHFASSMNSFSNIDEILWDVSKNCISRLKFEDCVIYLLDEKRNVLIQKAAWGPKTTNQNKILNPIEIVPGNGIVGSIALTGKGEIINDTSTDNRYIVDDMRRSSEIAVPIMQENKVIGVIDSEHSEKDFYTERHKQILGTIASLCAGKIKTIKAEQQAREREIEVLKLSKDVATSQLTALRMQMNPHFIFNALNSVQHYIMQGNVIEANRYLSKFSRLQREILHCSSQAFISLEKEIAILNSYLELEQYRFGDSFIYQVNMTEDIEPVEIEIPPMMLQPFIENAIWHGLMPRITNRNLSVHFDLHTDDILLATIRDNGIGRAASAKLRRSNGVANPDHESKGMSMIMERLRLLRHQYDKPFEATISDITDVNGTVQGTQVSLKIFIGNKKRDGLKSTDH